MKKTKQRPTHKRLCELLDYDPSTGIFVWKEYRCSRAKAGDMAGGMDNLGYTMVRLDYCAYRAHQLAWLYMTGGWQSGDIDHINGTRNDNRWINLRMVTHAVNMQNQRNTIRKNVAGFLGVEPCREKWRARIVLNGERYHVGTFDTPEAAHAAYLDAKRIIHEGCTI